MPAFALPDRRNTLLDYGVRIKAERVRDDLLEGGPRGDFWAFTNRR